MRIDKDFTFVVSISKEVYTNKQRAKAATKGKKQGILLRQQLGIKEKVTFIPIHTTAHSLLDKALNGSIFCALFWGYPTSKRFMTDSGYFTLSAKTYDYFYGSYFIGIDVDATRYVTPSDFISKLKFPPTFWYTTFSHQTKDENKDGVLDPRFRLIYVFDSIIQDPYFFMYCSSQVHHQVETDTEEKIDDKCGRICNQNFIGTNIQDPNLHTEYDITDFIYSFSDFQIDQDGYIDFLQHNCNYSLKNIEFKNKKNIQERLCKFLSQSTFNNRSTPPHPTPNILLEWDKTLQSDSVRCSILGFDLQMVADAEYLTFEKFHKYYKHRYRYVYRKENDNWIMLDDIRYQKCEEDYLELPWIILKKDKEGNSIPIKDGEHRKKKLFFRTWMRRIICPNITPSELLYNLIVDRHRYFDNSDDVLSMEFLKTTVESSFEYSIEELKDVFKKEYDYAKDLCEKKRFIIHWTCKDKIRANSLAKELRWRFLDDVYDRSLSVAENLQILEDSDCGEDVGFTRSSLYRYCKDRGICGNQGKQGKKMDLFIQLHKEGMSLREEVAYLAENGLKVSAPTISKWIKMLKEEASEQAT